MGLLLMEMGVDVATVTEHTTGSGGQKVVVPVAMGPSPLALSMEVVMWLVLVATLVAVHR